MKLKRTALVFIFVLSALLALGWLWSPQVLGMFVRGYLQALGFSQVAIQIEAVSSNELRVKHLSLTRGVGTPQRVDLYGAELRFALGELFNGKLQSLRIDSAVIVTRAAQAPSEFDIGTVFALLARSWHRDWPLNALSVRKLKFSLPSGDFSHPLSLRLTRNQTELTGEISLWETTGTPRSIRLRLEARGQLRIVLPALVKNMPPPMALALSLKEGGPKRHLSGRIEANLQPLCQWLKPELRPGSLQRVHRGRAEIEFSLSQRVVDGSSEVPWRGTVASRIEALVAGLVDGRQATAAPQSACLYPLGTGSAVTRNADARSLSSNLSPGMLRVAEASLKMSNLVINQPLRKGSGAIMFQAEGTMRMLQADSVAIGNAAIHFTAMLARHASTTELTIGPEVTARLDALRHPSVRLARVRMATNARRASRYRSTAQALLPGLSITLPDHWQIAMAHLRMDEFQLEGSPMEVILTELAWGSESLFPTVSGTIDTSHLVLRIKDTTLPCDHAHMAFLIDADALRGDFKLGLAEGTSHLDGEFTQLFGAGRGRVSFALSTLDFAKQKASLSQFLSEWPYAFDLVAGKLTLSGKLSWFQKAGRQGHGTTAGTVRIRLSQGGGFYQAIWFSGLETELVLRLAPSVRTTRSASVKVDLVDFGVSLKNVQLTVALLRSVRGPLPRLVIYDFEAGLFGGRLESQRIVVDANERVQHIPLHLKRVDLAQLATLYPVSGLQASGRLSGVLDLVVSEAGISVQQGKFRSEKPGGRIRYRPKSPARRLEAAVPGSVALFEALENFRYEVLRAKADYAVDGTLLLELHLEGTSPRLETGRPVHVNVSLEQNLLSLLKSLRLIDGLSKQMDREVRNHYEETEQRQRQEDSISP